MNKLSIIKFVEDKIPYIFNNNEKYIRWPEQPLYLKVYEEVPEHASAINFILKNLVVDGVEQIDFWTVKKLALDYLIYGAFTVEVIKLRNGNAVLNYVDVGKCRYSPDKKKLGYSEKWDAGDYKVDVKWVKKVDNLNEAGMFIFTNPLSRANYSTPYYLSSMKSLDTMTLISDYHNNNAKNGFTPNVLINFNNGEPDEDTKKAIEKKVEEKFTGANGQKFILSFNDNKETATTVEKLENDALDQKFETLQKFIQNQIMMAHQITSPQLIGVKAENQGFSKTEYEESFEIFQKVVISDLRRELEYGLSLLFGKEIVMKEKEVTNE